tara:strand:- start:65 stop:598 length:534 start_codon:yes stop_codon:yes gene_type:complete
MLIEFYLMLKKILIKKNKIILFFYLTLTLIYLLIFILCVSITFLFQTNNEINLLIMTITICISSDIGGYIFGKVIKGKKLTKISPKKTYAGLFGAYVLSLITSYIFFIEFYSLSFIILFSIIISTISQIGDLFISFLKRLAKIKDTGKFLPGHGGLLDRLDGILFAIPFSLILKLYI